MKRRLTGRLKLVHRDERDQPYVLCMTTAGREVRHDLPYEPSGRRARCPLCAERARERDRLWLIDKQRGQTAREGV